MPGSFATTNTSSSSTLEMGMQMSLSNSEKAPIKLLLDLEPHEDPKHLSIYRKWLAVGTICSAALCVTCASSIAAFTEAGVAEEYRVSHETTILSISLFVLGFGVGPLFLGPLSEFFGRNPVYWVSYGLYWVLTWPVAFAPNIAVYLTFRFITGTLGSAFLSVAGGSVSDLFIDDHVATPMAVYTLSPFIGPVLGPLLSGFINQHLYWRWSYRVMLIWSFFEMIALVLFVPETYEPILLKHKAQRLRQSSPQNCHIYAPIECSHPTIYHAIAESCSKPFQLLVSERMALLLAIWSSLVLGILYLTFQAFPVIFEDEHGFDYQSTGMGFIGMGLGLVSSLAFQPMWNRLYKRETEKHNGIPPPEMRLLPGRPAGILVSLGLLLIALSTFPRAHWILPMLASIPFGLGVAWVFTSTFTYLVTAYRPIAASAMAGNSAMRSSFAAAFPLFAPAMYQKLGTVGATALLAGLLGVMAPVPFVLHRYGERIRAKSKFAVS